MKPTPESLKLLMDGSVVLARAEHAGIRVDVERLDRQRERTARKIARLEQELWEDDIGKLWRKTFGNKSTLRSRPQLAVILFDKLGHEVVGAYDFVIVDCPPTLGLLTLNALVAADGVIIPVQTQYYALKGVAALLKIIKTVQTRLNPRLRVLGLLPTFYDSRTILGRDMLASLHDLGDHQIFRTVIRQSVKIGEAPTAGVPITVYEPRSEAAKSFIDLAKEVTGAH